MTPDVLAIYEDADLYDREFGNRDFDAALVQRWARRAGGTALELACGTGRLTLPLARAGYRITGVDLSPAMIARAKTKVALERLDVRLFVADGRSLVLGEQFAFVFCVANALQHLTEPGDAAAFLARAREHLSPSGLLLLAVFNPDPRKLVREPAWYEKKRFDDVDGREIVVHARSRYDRSRQVLDFDLDYRREGSTTHSKRIAMRCFFPDELLQLVEAAGLTVVERFGDYDEAPFASGSPHHIVVCRAR